MLQVAIRGQRLFLRLDGRAVAALVVENGADAVRLDRGAPTITGRAAEIQGAKVSRQRLVEAPFLGKRLGEIVQGIRNFVGHLRFLAQLQRPLEVGLPLRVLPLLEVDRADIVENERLAVGVADVATNLE